MLFLNFTSSNGIFDNESQKIIHLSEESFEERIASVTLSLWMFLIVVVGFIGNGLIVFVFARERHLRKKYFLIIMISILYASGSLFFSLNSYHIYFHKIMEEPICTIHAYAISTLSVGGIHQLTVLSIERYIGVNHPFVLMKLSLRTKLLFASGAFFWTLLTTTPPLLGWSKYKVLDDSLHYCVFDYLSKERSTQLYILYLFFNGYIAPLSIIGFSNYKIFLTAKGMIKTRKSGIYKKHFQSQELKLSNTHQSEQELCELENICISSNLNEKKIQQSLLSYDRQQRKCARVIFYCVGSFVISWTPYAFASIVSNIIFDTRMNKNFVLLTAVAAKMFVIWNPIIYGLMDRTFKTECAKFFSKIFK